MKIYTYLSKIADLLYQHGYNGKIIFDHLSYDLEKNIPTINIDKIIKVVKFNISRDGRLIEIYGEDDVYTLDFTNLPDDFTDKYFEKIGLFNLIQNVYYETNESGKIGDFDMDFLNNSYNI